MGIVAGDVIVEAGGKKVATARAVAKGIAAGSASGSVSFKVMNSKGEHRDLTVPVPKKPAAGSSPIVPGPSRPRSSFARPSASLAGEKAKLGRVWPHMLRTAGDWSTDETGREALNGLHRLCALNRASLVRRGAPPLPSAHSAIGG